ncbi:carboxypeptidase-like regulatory domain-containing protein [Catellatospora chokoriensis]|uniref:carboxypeptidase-like regulatory domain-containing protein n=1 Tax=Catellatospora chokoriensis TaxID=310353 RepID=UPI001781B27C|nr:carboxypeptidase-like regulatory domain-containing protein [Catellatospora chokoriensis]
MLKTSARRLGVLALALAIGTLGLAAPAQAADTASITGRLTDGGLPAAGVSVSASSLSGAGSGFTSTDDTGHYTLPNLPAGVYRVSYWASGRQTWYAPGTVAYHGSSSYLLTPGAQLTIDGELLPLGTITGTFRDRAGNGMAGVSVSAGPVGSGDGVSAQTDENGRYSLRVSQGVYVVSFRIDWTREQYAPGAADSASATRYTVTGGQTVTVDDTLVGTGTVAGRFTDRAGVALAGVDVAVRNEQGNLNYYTTTDEAGEYRVEVLPSEYTVQFTDHNRLIAQYARGKGDRFEADPVTVTTDATTRVDDTQLANGSVQVTATDSVTGEPVPAFSVHAGQSQAEGVDGSATVYGVPVGRQSYSIWADGYNSVNFAAVTVTEGPMAEVAVVLSRTARIAATVVDAQTGAPVAGFCVEATAPSALSIGMGCMPSDSEGKVVLDRLQPGPHQLFAYGQPWAETASPYGAQWVTADGGTGNQTLAAVVTAVAGETVTGPTIKLDRRGTITGTVRAADGTPAKNAYVGFGNIDYSNGGGGISVPVATDGRYSVDFLGPYLWPVHFYADGHAPQWSGNSGGRSGATKVKVRAGKSVPYDIRLLKGTKVTVKAPVGGYYAAYHAATGEASGACDGRRAAMTCDMLVLGGQKVRFKVWGEGEHFWHGGADFATATSVNIPTTGTKTVTVTR